MTRQSKASAGNGSGNHQSKEGVKGQRRKTQAEKPPLAKTNHPAETETESTLLCRAFKKALKDGTVDERWDEVGDHHIFTFRNLKPAVVCVSRYVEGRKLRYELHMHTISEVELNIRIYGFDYEHRSGKLKLRFDAGDDHEISFERDFDE